MKQLLTTLRLCAAALAAAVTAARGQTPVLAWDADASAARPAQADVYRGETVALRPAFLERGAPADTNGAAFTLYWQTNGMGAAWWSDPTNAFRWTPARDCGAAAYTLFIRCDTAAGASYRANARLRMLDSPGAEPNAMPLPVQSIDFAAVTALNAPWPSAADLQAASNALAAAVQPLGPRLDLIESGTNAWQTAYGWGDHAAAGYLLPADIAGLATTQQVAAAVSPLGPRIAALEGGTNAWQTAYGWGDHALAGYLLPADLSPYATTQQVAEAAAAILRDRIITQDGSQWIDATGGVWRAVEGTGGWALTLLSYPYEAHVGEIDWYAPAGYSEYADPGWWALYVESTGTGFDISVITGFGEWGAGDVQPISPITLSPVGMGAEGDVTLWLSGGANTSRVDGVAWQSDIAAIRTNYVALADKEMHADSFTNLIWRSVFSNGWHFLIAYTNTPGGAE